MELASHSFPLSVCQYRGIRPSLRLNISLNPCITSETDLSRNASTQPYLHSTSIITNKKHHHYTISMIVTLVNQLSTSHQYLKHRNVNVGIYVGQDNVGYLGPGILTTFKHLFFRSIYIHWIYSVHLNMTQDLKNWNIHFSKILSWFNSPIASTLIPELQGTVWSALLLTLVSPSILFSVLLLVRVKFL